MTSSTPSTAWMPSARPLRPLALGNPGGGRLSRHAREVSRELLATAARGARHVYPQRLGARSGAAGRLVAAEPLSARANRTAQLAVGLGGGYCALWSYLWLRQGMQGAACAAWLHHREVVPPRGPYAEVLLPAMLAATVLVAAASWARSFEARPVTRTVAAVAVLTAACLLCAGAVDDRPGAGVPLLLGTGVSAAGARWGESRLPPTLRRRAPGTVLPLARQDVARKPATPEPTPTPPPEGVPLLAGEYEVV